MGLVGYPTSMTLVIHIWTSSAPYGPFKECFFTGSLKLCLRVGVEINWFPLIGDRDKHSVYLTIKTTAMYCFKVLASLANFLWPGWWVSNVNKMFGSESASRWLNSAVVNSK